MRFLLSFALFLALLCSCAEPKIDAQIIEIARRDSVIMHVHDEVMPKIAKVLALRKRIQHKIDSVTSTNNLAHLQTVSYALTKADAAMMNWMRSYQIPAKSDTAIAYLKAQEIEINRISAAIYESIQLADSTLKTIAP